MSSDGCKHKIDLDNLENDEVIQNSLVLIKGTIKNQHSTLVTKCRTQTIELVVRQRHPLQERHNEAGVWELQFQAQVARNGQFKLLCDLNRYEIATDIQVPLQLKFSFCKIIHLLELLYEGQTNNPNCYRLQSLYIACCGDTLDAEHVRETCEKIDLNLRLVQCVYSDQLRAAGFGRLTFTLNGQCQVFQSRLTCAEVWKCNEDSLWQLFAQELLNSSIWGSDTKLKFVAFIGCTKYDGAAVAASGDFSYASIRRNLKGHAALGGGGLALFGGAYLYAWPQHFSEIISCFCSVKAIDLTRLPDDSNYRRTFGGVYATTLGAVVHEIGHTFDLGHTSNGVMGNGFDYINRVFTVDNLTEHLPDRIIQSGEQAATALATIHPRFTQFKRTTNTFLEKYHEQKTSDPFYFTRNCVIILAQNKWFSKTVKGAVAEKWSDAQITYDAESGCVLSAEKAHPLCLIEVRCMDNSLVKYWYDLQRKENNAIYKFVIPKEARQLLELNHYLFVITQTGQTKRFCER